MYSDKYLDGSLNPKNVVDTIVFNIKFSEEHPDYFRPEGLLVFCGSQGSGKTLSAVQYCKKVLEDYPKAIFCTDTFIHQYPINCYYVKKSKVIKGIEHTFISYKLLCNDKRVRTVDSYFFGGQNFCIIKDYPGNWPGDPQVIVVEYNGLDCIKDLINGEYGIIYFKDEIHLEFNSLESKNIPIEIMIEVSQQRKQRKHIVGTSQIYGRLAKPFREQVKNVVLCSNYLKLLQVNHLIDGDKSMEKDGMLVTETVKKFYWFHSPALYNSYDTYAKMKRYNKEWKGRKME